jgi:hypothetical protein
MSSSLQSTAWRKGVRGRVLYPFAVFLLASICACSSSRGEETPLSTANTGSLAEISRTIDVKAALAGRSPVFVSDYFSFVGADEKGHVAFAIDNDRARRGNKYTADAHVVLHDEQEGWIRISGAGKYDNKRRELVVIPDSPYFQFIGDVKNGIELDSPRNQLKLTVGPMIERVSRVSSQAIYSLGSTSATLQWRSRVIRGRVIYEYIFMKNLSPWYSAFSGLFFNDFQGLYLETSEGDDFYLHTSKGEAWSRMIEKVMGFQVIKGQSEVLHDLRIGVRERSFGLGFYRWPKTWQVSWQGRKGRGSLSVSMVDRKTVTNWLIGGFAMTVVSGEMTYGGKTRPVYGLGELIR